MSASLQLQGEFAALVRTGLGPAEQVGIEVRRLRVYRELVERNLQGFLDSGFPVLRRTLSGADWAHWGRRFRIEHRCQTPFFHEISAEFVAFLQGLAPTQAPPPVWMQELAHYEWTELELDLASEELPTKGGSMPPNWNQHVPVLSPLARLLQYRHPVHRIGGEGVDPEDLAPTGLVAWRDRAHQVRFMEVNPLSMAVLELCRTGELTGVEVLTQLARDAQMEPAELVPFGQTLLSDLEAKDILLVVPDAPRCAGQ